MSKDKSIPAFPSKDLPYSGHDSKGMTLRDYFAAKAMQGLIASPRGPVDGKDPTAAYYAITAYKVADAMMEARK